MPSKKLLLLASVLVLGSLETNQIVQANENTQTESQNQAQTFQIPESGSAQQTQTPQNSSQPAGAETESNVSETNQAGEQATDNQTPATDSQQEVTTPREAASPATTETAHSTTEETLGSPATTIPSAENQSTPEQDSEAAQESSQDQTSGQGQLESDTVSAGTVPDSTQEANEPARLEDDFYTAINQEWLETAEIPSDRRSYGSMEEADELTEKQIKERLTDLTSGEATSQVEGMEDFVKLYQQATDFDQRAEDGLEPLKPYLESIEDMTSINDLAQEATERVLHGQVLPFTVGVSPSTEDTSRNEISLGMPGTILAEHHYQNPATKEAHLAVFKEMAMEMLEQLDYDQATAQKIVDDTLAFDSLLVPYLSSAEASSDVTNQIHKKTADQVAAFSSTLALDQVINELAGQKVSQVNVSNPDYFDNLDQLVNDQEFGKLKSWLLLQEVFNHSSYLTEDLRQTQNKWIAYRNGGAVSSKEDVALSQAMSLYSESWSVDYAQQFLDPQVKEEVTQMIENMVDVYKERLTDNEWLSQGTKEKAIEKLDKLNYFVGGPEGVSDLIEWLKVDDQLSYFDNIKQLQTAAIYYQFSQFNQPVDKDRFKALSYEVNAYYHPQYNAIYFPAAILTAPFYDSQQSAAANYGGIGAIIAHEITHAFDNNGSLFDENGNINNWWTEEDYQAFNQRLQAMVQLFDGVQTEHGPVNGRLTVGENTADAGGLTVSLTALKAQDPEADLTDFFTNYATVSRRKIRPEVAQHALATDTHSPSIARTNVQLANNQDFQDTYCIQPTDKMYLAPEKRVVIW